MRLLDAIRSIFFNIIFYIFSILFLGLVVTPLCFTGSEKIVRWGVGAYCRNSVRLARWVMGIKVEFRGVENLPESGALILAAAHQSNMDPMLAYCLRGDVTALAKKELFNTPFVGRILRHMKVVRIDRQARDAHKGMDAVGKQVMELGKPLIIYPQATRTAIGKYRKLKSGVYYMHRDNDLPVIAVATTTGLCWTRGFWHRSGTVVFDIREPFPSGLEKDEFMALLKEWVVDHSDDLVREAGYGHLLPKSQPRDTE